MRTREKRIWNLTITKTFLTWPQIIHAVSIKAGSTRCTIVLMAGSSC